jgi:chromosome segregation ATPase/phage tail protein X
MAFVRVRFCWVLILPVLTLASGCNYIHFGRIDRAPTDAALAASNSDLRMEKKLLQQELTIARKESETLRAALDRPNAPGSEALATKLNETSRQLAALRADYAKLQAKRDRLSGEQSSGGAEQITELKNQLGQTEEKLAASLRNFTQLQEDTQRLRTEVDQAHAENATLTSRVETITAQNVEVRSALAQLNTELLAQKESRAQSEQNVEALRTQLRAMADQSRTEPATSLQMAQTNTAPVAAGRLSVDAAKLRAVAAIAAAADPGPDGPARKSASRTYIVRDGDTLEKIAAQFYGKPERWALLYSANNALLSGGRPLKAGMQLEVPEQ